VAAKSAAILDRHSTRWRSRTAVGAEEWLRRGQTKEWVRKQVSCQDSVITIREGRHQVPWHKKQEQSRISPSDTVVVLMWVPDKTVCHVDDPTGTPLNVRSTPNGPILGALNNDTVVTVVETTLARGQKWVRIVPEIGKPGWVFRNYFDCNLEPDTH
jgi:Bacterial SH3 domain